MSDTLVQVAEKPIFQDLPSLSNTQFDPITAAIHRYIPSS
jgi:hypothetical protein